MPEDPYAESGDELNRPWDEYRWERFLQASDRRTEKYGELLDRYADHPDRDAIIAREMGWELESEDDDDELEEWQREQLADRDGDSGAEAPSAEDLAEEAGDSTDEDDESEDEAEDDPELWERERHPLSLEARAYSHRLLSLVDEQAADPAHKPIYDALLGGAMICAAKLTVFSLGGTRPELGMLIAYAKRSLKALTDSLGALEPARRAGILREADAISLQNQVFQVRSGIISLIGELRAEFRRQHQ